MSETIIADPDHIYIATEDYSTVKALLEEVNATVVDEWVVPGFIDRPVQEGFGFCFCVRPLKPSHRKWLKEKLGSVEGPVRWSDAVSDTL